MPSKIHRRDRRRTQRGSPGGPVGVICQCVNLGTADVDKLRFELVKINPAAPPLGFDIITTVPISSMDVTGWHVTDSVSSIAITSASLDNVGVVEVQLAATVTAPVVLSVPAYNSQLQASSNFTFPGLCLLYDPGP